MNLLCGVVELVSLAWLPFSSPLARRFRSVFCF